MGAADRGWIALRDAASSAWRSPTRLGVAGLVTVVCVVLPAVVAYLGRPPDYQRVHEGVRLAAPRIGLVEVPRGRSFPVELLELGAFRGTVDVVARVGLGLGGAVLVAMAGAGSRGEPEGRAWRSLASNPIPLLGWIALDAAVAGVAFGALAGALGGQTHAPWIRQSLAIAWAAVTLLVLPAIVLGGESIVAALASSVSACRRRPTELAVAAGGLALAGVGLVAEVSDLALRPLAALWGWSSPWSPYEGVLLFNLVAAVPLVFYAAAWFSLQAELYEGGS